MNPENQKRGLVIIVLAAVAIFVAIFSATRSLKQDSGTVVGSLGDLSGERGKSGPTTLPPAQGAPPSP